MSQKLPNIANCSTVSNRTKYLCRYKNCEVDDSYYFALLFWFIAFFSNTYCKVYSVHCDNACLRHKLLVISDTLERYGLVAYNSKYISICLFLCYYYKVIGTLNNQYHMLQWRLRNPKVKNVNVRAYCICISII